MRGISDVKKLAVAAAGAAILGLGLAAAPALYYGDTQLVNDQGQPQVKVVVGANAMASDGVAAALIAQTIANNAYATQTLQATWQGTATCVMGGEGGTGTCPVYDEQVTLEFSTPGGTAPGEYYFTTNIADFIDRDTEDREIDEYGVYTDVTKEESNPFQNQKGGIFYDELDDFGDGGVGSGYDVSENSLYVREDLFTPRVLNSGTGRGSWTEQEGLYIGGATIWTDDEGVQARIPYVTYVVDFEPDDRESGLPLCPGDEDTGYNNCASDDAIQANHVPIYLFGKEWIVSDVYVPNTENVYDEREIYSLSGSYIKLAEAAIPPTTMYNGDNVTFGNYVVRYDGASSGEECGDTLLHPALFNVTKYDSAGNPVESKVAKVCPGETEEITFNTGGTLKVHVYQTGISSTLRTDWCKMTIFENEIKVEHGKAWPTDDDKNWYVALGWMGETDNSTVKSPRYLKKIVVYRTDEYDPSELDSDESVTVMDGTDYEVYSVTYQGVTNPDDWDATFTIEEKASGDLSNFDKVYNSSTSSDYCQINATAYVKIDLSNMELDAKTQRGDYARGRKAYVIYANSSGTTCDVTTDQIGPHGVYIVVEDDEGNKHLIADDYEGTLDVAGDAYYIPLDSDDAVVVVADAEAWSGTAEDIIVGVSEKAGEYEGDDVIEVIYRLVDTSANEMYAETGTGTVTDEFHWAVDKADDPEDYTTDNYQPLTNFLDEYSSEVSSGEPDLSAPSVTTYDEDFVSWRGSEVSSLDKDSFKVTVPTEVLRAQYVVRDTTVSGNATGNTWSVTLAEGDEYNIPGTDVTLRVADISYTVGACTISDGGTCTCNTSGITATIAPYDTPTVEAAVPYALTSPLVVTDNEIADLSVENVISVGGPVVNTVTADLLSGGAYQLDPSNRVLIVEVEPGKIVVAGYEAQDTMAAAQQFVEQLQTQP